MTKKSRDAVVSNSVLALLESDGASGLCCATQVALGCVGFGQKLWVRGFAILGVMCYLDISTMTKTWTGENFGV